MIIVTIMGIIAVSIAYFAKYKSYRQLLLLSFAIIFVFLAIRYNYGNDYISYYVKYEKINKYSSIELINNKFYLEIGWVALCRVFRPLGFIFLVTVLAIITCYTYYKLIKKYVPAKYYWLAVFIYIFTPDFMLLQLSAMRQSLAISLFILSIEHIQTRKFIKYLAYIIAATLFHSSAIILIFLYPLVTNNIIKSNSFKKYSIGIFGLIILIIVSFNNEIYSFINVIVYSYFKRYMIYENTTAEIGSGIGIILLSIQLLLLLHYLKYQKGRQYLIYIIAILSYLMIPLDLFINNMIGRIGMYFQVCIIIVYPILIYDCEGTHKKYIIISIILLFTIYTYYRFFESPIYGNYYNEYYTIFSAAK